MSDFKLHWMDQAMRLGIVMCLLQLVLCHSAAAQVPAGSAETRFITRQGDRLYEGDREFRFVSWNIPNLHLVEDDFAAGATSPWNWPNEYEIRDALEAVRQMGGMVVRTYVLSVAREGSDMGDHVYVRGPDQFNEEAYQVLDLVLKIAREKGVRICIPLVDQWRWWGGRAEYAAFRGRQPDEFWSDEQLIQDFEATVRYTLNRTNTLTGVRYKDDPTIFAWETGNELDCPAAWTKRIAATIKALDARHLVVDGYSLHVVRQESLEDPNIDVVTTHHYPSPGRDLPAAIRTAAQTARGKKPYFVGEFGFIPLSQMKELINLVHEEEFSGALLWSLRFHHRDGGFYWHSEPLGAGLYKAYHWPGFASADAYEERAVMALVRKQAFAIRGLPEPFPSIPDAPRLLEIQHPSAISWQGSCGANAYDVYRASAVAGPWEIVGKSISDARFPYKPLFQDASVKAGESYCYRVVAHNEAGDSEPSNIVGPVAVDLLALVDECADKSKLAYANDRVEATTGQDRQTREDQSRLRITPGGVLSYQVSGAIHQWRMEVYLEGAGAKPEVTCSTNGQEYSSCEYTITNDATTRADYGYLQRIVLTGGKLSTDVRYLQIRMPKEAGQAIQLARTEVYHGAVE